MLGWLFPLLLVCWLATMFLEKRLHRYVLRLPPQARQHVAAHMGEDLAPTALRRAVLLGQYRPVSDAGFVQACGLYRASIVLYIIVVVGIVIAVLLAFSSQ